MNVHEHHIWKCSEFLIYWISLTSLQWHLEDINMKCICLKTQNKAWGRAQVADCCFRKRSNVSEAGCSLLTAAFICVSAASCRSFCFRHRTCLAPASHPNGPGSYHTPPANVAGNGSIRTCWKAKLMHKRINFKCNVATTLLRLFCFSFATKCKYLRTFLPYQLLSIIYYY